MSKWKTWICSCTPWKDTASKSEANIPNSAGQYSFLEMIWISTTPEKLGNDILASKGSSLYVLHGGDVVDREQVMMMQAGGWKLPEIFSWVGESRWAPGRQWSDELNRGRMVQPRHQEGGRVRGQRCRSLNKCGFGSWWEFLFGGFYQWVWRLGWRCWGLKERGQYRKQSPRELAHIALAIQSDGWVTSGTHLQFGGGKFQVKTANLGNPLGERLP